MKDSTLLIPAPLRAYMLAHSVPLGAVQHRLIEQTAALSQPAHRQTAPAEPHLDFSFADGMSLVGRT